VLTYQPRTEGGGLPARVSAGVCRRAGLAINACAMACLGMPIMLAYG
jgi:hypothetical protein